MFKKKHQKSYFPENQKLHLCTIHLHYSRNLKLFSWAPLMIGYGGVLWSDHLYPPGGQRWSLFWEFQKTNEKTANDFSKMANVDLWVTLNDLLGQMDKKSKVDFTNFGQKLQIDLIRFWKWTMGDSEVVQGSWPETWMIGSYIILVDDYRMVQKVLSRSDLIKALESYSPGGWVVTFGGWSHLPPTSQM